MSIYGSGIANIIPCDSCAVIVISYWVVKQLHTVVTVIQMNNNRAATNVLCDTITVRSVFTMHPRDSLM